VLKATKRELIEIRFFALRAEEEREHLIHKEHNAKVLSLGLRGAGTHHQCDRHRAAVQQPGDRRLEEGLAEPARNHQHLQLLWAGYLF